MALRPPDQALPPLGHFVGMMAENVSAAMAGEPERPIIKAKQDLSEYLERTFGARLPKKACCHGHTAPWDAFCAAYFATSPVIVIKGSRGLAGKTYLLGLLAMAEATLLGADVTILGGSGRQSRRVHKAMAQFWSAARAPRHLLLGEPGVMVTKFRDGNEVEALTASQKSVRSPHPQRLRLDEVDEMDLKIFTAALGQTLSDRGISAQTTISSTHQNATGTFTEVLKMAHDKGWPIFEWCYVETLQSNGGWLAQSEVDRKRGEMTAEMWRTEVELQEPSAEGRAIDTDAVERMFDRTLGESDGELGKVEEFEQPQPRATYSTGADWGKSAHMSAIPTLRTDCAPAKFVAFYRDRKKPYHLMVPKLNERVKKYGGSACHDAHGVGAVIDEELTCDAEGYTSWQGAQRIALFSEYIAAIERGSIRAPLSEPWYRAHRYVTNNDLYGTGHPPDEFIGCALAYRASRLAGDVKAITDVTVWD